MAHARRSKIQANVYEQSEYDSEPKRFCALAQNEHQFGQIGAVGDEENGCVFFSCLLLPLESVARNVQNGFTQSMLVVNGSLSLLGCSR